MEGLVCAVEWRLLNTSRRPDLNNDIYKWKSVARMIAFLSFANGHATLVPAGELGGRLGLRNGRRQERLRTKVPVTEMRSKTTNWTG